MADRILTWYIDTLVDDQASLGPTFIMDRDYQPRVVRVHAKRAPGVDMTFDLRNDGVSFLGTPLPVLAKGDVLEEVAQDFIVPADVKTLAKYSLVTLHLTSGGTSGITVQLELVAEEDDEVAETDT